MVRTSFVENTKIDLAFVPHLPKIRHMINYLVHPKFVKFQVSRNVSNYVAKGLNRYR